MKGLQAAAVRLGRALAVLAAAGVAIYASARVSVRMPLAIPLALVGLVLALIAAMCRRPPRDLFADRMPDEPKPAPALEAAKTAHSWAFDEEEF